MGKFGLCFKCGLCRLIGQFCCDTVGCKTQVALLCCDRSMSNVGDGDIITTILHLCYEYEFRIGIIYIYKSCFEVKSDFSYLVIMLAFMALKFH